MKKIMLLVALFIGFAGFSQSLDCARFKKVKYYSPAHPGQYAIMKDSIQENYTNDKLEIIWNLNWLSECKYEVVCTKNMGSEPIQPGDRLIYTIINTEDDCFTVSVLYKNKDNSVEKTFQRGFCIKKD